MRYDIRTGVQHKKANMKKVIIGGLASLATVGVMAASALAAGPGYNPPTAVSDVCNAGHGAFAAFSDPALHGDPSSGQPPYFGDDVLGSARGGVTGANNSNYSQFCQNL